MIHHLLLVIVSSFTIAIGAIIGIAFVVAVNVTMVFLCLYYHKVWKPKHQHAPVSGRAAVDGHGGGDESYVKIDLHDVSHLSMTVHGYMLHVCM